jgi:hypothetical protein
MREPGPSMKKWPSIQHFLLFLVFITKLTQILVGAEEEESRHPDQETESGRDLYRKDGRLINRPERQGNKQQEQPQKDDYSPIQDDARSIPVASGQRERPTNLLVVHSLESSYKIFSTTTFFLLDFRRWVSFKVLLLVIPLIELEKTAYLIWRKNRF